MYAAGGQNEDQRKEFPLWAVNCYTGSFMLKICTSNNSSMFNYCSTLYYSDAFHKKYLGNPMIYTNISIITNISFQSYMDS